LAKITLEEKTAVQKICAVAKKDKAVVHDLLYSILLYTTKELYKGNRSIVIPFICTLNIEEKDILNTKDNITEKKVMLSATPLQGLIDEITAISNDEITPSEKYLKKKIFSRLKDLLEVDDLELEEDEV
jgi:hypothetical protein